MQCTVAHTLDASAQSFRNAMANVATAVHVVTTDGIAGRRGITITALSSVSDDPPTVLLCINRQALIQPVLRANKSLCINVINGDQQQVAEDFAGRAGLSQDERFARHQWLHEHHHQWALHHALAHLYGHITDAHEVGSHTVFYVAIDHIVVNDQPLPASVYFRRNFCSQPA